MATGLDPPDASRRVVDDLLGFMDAPTEPIGALDKQLLAQGRGDPQVATRTRLPGVGTLIAQIIVAEIGDITRFPCARKLTAWAGLTPTVRGSDLTVKRAHNSKQGSD